MHEGFGRATATARALDPAVDSALSIVPRCLAVAAFILSACLCQPVSLALRRRGLFPPVQRQKSAARGLNDPTGHSTSRRARTIVRTRIPDNGRTIVFIDRVFLLGILLVRQFSRLMGHSCFILAVFRNSSAECILYSVSTIIFKVSSSFGHFFKEQ